uniref:Uncharacterized protein n=1 Tax=Hippocampus comes TaxID=109280 RepID=A0A3Q2XIA7_HIPCM
MKFPPCKNASFCALYANPHRSDFQSMYSSSFPPPSFKPPSYFLSFVSMCYFLRNSVRSATIKTNQDLLPATPWTNILYDDFWGTLLTHSGSHKSFRPLCTLTFRLNYALHGLRPFGYHLLNVALHGLVTATFTAFSRPLLGGGPWSLLAGLLFAAHPVHTEAVAGVVGRADVGAALFFLLSLLCYARHCGLRARRCRGPGGSAARRWTWMAGSLWCAAASMLWKEQGVTVLAVLAVYDLFVFHRLTFRQALLLPFGKVKLGKRRGGFGCTAAFLKLARAETAGVTRRLRF